MKNSKKLKKLTHENSTLKYVLIFKLTINLWSIFSDKCKISYSTWTHDHLDKLSKVYKPIKVKSFFFQILDKDILMTLAHRWCIVLIIKTWNLPGFEPTRKLNLGFLRKIPWLATLSFEVKSQILSSTFFKSKGFSGDLRCFNFYFWDSQR